MRQGWGGRPIRIEQAQGILVAALGVLAGWYGYGQADASRPAEGVAGSGLFSAACEIDVAVLRRLYIRGWKPEEEARNGRV